MIGKNFNAMKYNDVCRFQNDIKPDNFNLYFRLKFLGKQISGK